MKESLLATAAFWGAFMFSVGPWWVAFMEAAKNTPNKILFRNIGVYIVVGWLPFVVLTGGLIRLLGGVHPRVLNALYFLGGALMLHFAYKTLGAKIGRATALNFDWRAMTLLVWGNPKAWLSIPAGSLAAVYTDNPAINLFFFFLLSIPWYLAAAAIWATIGRQGAKWTGGKLSYVNAFLLAAFAAYLFYQGALLAFG